MDKLEKFITGKIEHKALFPSSRIIDNFAVEANLQSRGFKKIKTSDEGYTHWKNQEGIELGCKKHVRILSTFSLTEEGKVIILYRVSGLVLVSYPIDRDVEHVEFIVDTIREAIFCFYTRGDTKGTIKLDFHLKFSK